MHKRSTSHSTDVLLKPPPVPNFISTANDQLHERIVLPDVFPADDHPGCFSFQVDFEQNSELIGTPGIYASDLKKLFVPRKSLCPIAFRFQGKPPPGSGVRVFLTYKSTEDFQTVVQNCHHHINTPEDGSSFHVIRCQNSSTIYESCPETKHLSLFIPLSAVNRLSEENSFKEYFQFMCFNTCMSGMKRRSTLLFLRLEQGTEVYGQAVVEVKICGSPKRVLANQRRSLNENNKPETNQRLRTDELTVKELKETFSTDKNDDGLNTTPFISMADDHLNVRNVLPYALSTVGNPGCFSFGVGIEKNSERIQQTTPWIYARDQNMLFVRRGCWCPVRFTFLGNPPPGSGIRIFLTYKNEEVFKKIVQACPYHMETLNNGSNSHVMRCQNSSTICEICPKTEHLSLFIPMSAVNLLPCKSCFTEYFKFLCFNSCLDGMINLRPTLLIFRLEHGAKVYGQTVVNLEVCASPRRHFLNWSPSSNQKNKSDTNKRPRTDELSVKELEETFPTDKKDDAVYVISAQGSDMFAYLKKKIAQYGSRKDAIAP